MDTSLFKPFDQTYYETLQNIGLVHVRICLPPPDMFCAMNVVRTKMGKRLEKFLAHASTSLQEALSVLGKIFDLELAVMLHTYREDLVSYALCLAYLSPWFRAKNEASVQDSLIELFCFMKGKFRIREAQWGHVLRSHCLYETKRCGNNSSWMTTVPSLKPFPKFFAQTETPSL